MSSDAFAFWIEPRMNSMGKDDRRRWEEQRARRNRTNGRPAEANAPLAIPIHKHANAILWNCENIADDFRILCLNGRFPADDAKK